MLLATLTLPTAWNGIDPQLVKTSLRLNSFVGRVVPTLRRQSPPPADLIFMPSSDAAPGVDSALAKRLESIISRCPTLTDEIRYSPPPFASNPVANLVLSVLKRKAAERSLPFKLRTQIVQRDDDDDLRIVWADLRSSGRSGRDLPADAPVLLILHTITGDAETMKPIMRVASSRGWRACVLLRRGHGGHKLSETASFNVLGDVRDTAAQVEAVRKAHPSASFFGMVGVSAGSGLLVSYCGQMGERAQIDAATALCPAYDIREAFSALGADSPRIEKAMVRQLKNVFLHDNEEVLRAFDADALAACKAATSLDEFMWAHAPFALRRRGAGADEYYEHSNPMKYIRGSRTPMLILNSADDMVCRAENIRSDLVRSQPGYALVKTVRGSHIAFNEGLLGERCFMTRLTLDFMDAAVREKRSHLRRAVV